MEMSNATAAGPSYGLLDVIFGTANAKKENSEKTAEGEDKKLKPFLELLNSLGEMEASDEEVAEELGRTATETDSNGNSAEGGVPENPMDYLASLGANAKFAGGMSMGVDNMLSESAIPDASVSVKPEIKQMLSMMKAASSEMKLEAVDNQTQLPNLKAETMDKLNSVRNEKPVMNELIAKLNQKTQGTEEGAKLSHAHLSTEDFLAFDKKHKEAVELNTKSSKLTQAPLEALKAKQSSSQNGGQSSNQQESNLGKFDFLKSRLGDTPQTSSVEGAFDLQGALSNAPKLNGATPLTPQDMNIFQTETIPKLINNVSMQATKGGGTMNIVLNPEGMGEINLNVKADGSKVDVTIITSNSDAASLLRESGEVLREGLSGQMLNLGKLDISTKESTLSSNLSSDSENNDQADSSLADMDKQEQGAFAEEKSEYGDTGEQSYDLDAEGQKESNLGVTKNSNARTNPKGLVDVQA